MEDVFTRLELQNTLEKAGLPHSRVRLNDYEREGIIKRPTRGLKRMGRQDTRLYTRKEIDRIVVQITAYRKRLKRPTKDFGKK